MTQAQLLENLRDPRRLPIRIQLTVLIGLLIAAIAGFMFVYFPKRLERQALGATRDRTESMARVVAFSVAPALYFADTAAVIEGLQPLRTNPLLRYATVYDSRGRQIAGIYLNPADSLSSGMESDLGIIGDIFAAQAMIDQNGAAIGSLRLGFSLAPMRAEVSATRRHIALVSIVVFLVGIMAVYGIGVLVTRPVTAIAITARRVAAGDLTQRVGGQQFGEAGQVAAAINGMLNNLQLAQSELRQVNHSLEDRVAARTTELVASAEALEVSRDAAQAASRAKSEFLANMSHEIRTPMNGVLGMVELALDASPNPQLRDYLETAHSSAEALLGIINDILDFSKIEARMMTIDPVNFNLRELIETTLQGLGGSAHSKNVELIANIDSSIPQVVLGDAMRLRQVLVNLVGNAVKFTLKGEVEVGVVLAGSANDRVTLRFTVRDTGAGIPLEKQGAIFGAFAQADGSTTRRHGGTGLGLTISSQLVELMGGRIWVESAPGQGSRFYFEVTLGISTSAFPPENPDQNLQGIRALVVDDNATNRQILSETLEAYGVQVTLAAHGPAALAARRAAMDEGKDFQVVLVDGHMPDLDGFDVVERMQTLAGKAGPVIMMLTSSAGAEPRQRCADLGIAAMLTKPIMRSDLLSALSHALGITRVEASMPVDRWGMTTRPLHILLAEDNQVNQKLAVALLVKRGHSVRVAVDGVKAVQAFSEEHFDVILMDVQMPEMGGFEATAAIRAIEKENGKHIPIVALTAHAMVGDRELCLAAGMDGYVSKPIRFKDLISEVEGMFSGAEPVELPLAGVAQDDPGLLERFMNDVDLLCSVAEVYLETEPHLRQQLRAAITEGDAVLLARAAHSIKGSVGNYGADTAYHAAVTLEQLARDGNLSEAVEVLGDLERALDDLRAQLGRIMQAHRLSGAWKGENNMSTGDAPPLSGKR